MANRMTRQFIGALEPDVKLLYLDVSFGSSGAPTIVRGKGIQSVVRQSAGVYKISFGMISVPASPVDTYRRLLAINIASKGQPQDTNNIAPLSYVVDSVASGFVTVTFQNPSTGAAADPASGDEVLMRIELLNSAAY